MAKQKSFHEKVMQKLRRDAGFAWTGGFIGDMRALVGGGRGEELVAEHPVIGEGFVASLQQEAIIRMSDEDLRRASGKGLDDPFVYPGLMAAWESSPVTVDFEDGVLAGALEADPDFSGIPADAVRGLFPACLMIDVREYGLVLYKCAVDALFVYPSYDDERGYEVLLAVGVGLKRGLGVPFETKLVLEGDSLADMLVRSVDERERLRGRCLAGIDQGLHDEVFSPFEDEETVLLLLVMLLGIMLWDGSEVEESARRGAPHWHVRAAAGGEGAELGEAGAPSGGEGSGEPTPEEPPGVDALPGQAEEETGLELLAADADAGGEAAVPDVEGEQPPTEPGNPPDSEDSARLRELLVAQESKSATLEYHLKQARAAVDEAKTAADGARARAAVLESMDLPRTPAESLALAERAFPDRLVFLPGARKSAGEFRRGDAGEVWAVLRSMATVLHPLVFGKGGGNIIRAFEDQAGFELTLREMKMIKNTGQFSRLRTVTYKGAEHDASTHVKGRGTKKGETLRVHFFADYGDGRLVITHCGEHLDTYVTPSL